MTSTSRLFVPGSVQEGVHRDRWQDAEEKPGAPETLGESLSSTPAQRSRAQIRHAASKRCLTSLKSLLKRYWNWFMQLTQCLCITGSFQNSMKAACRRWRRNISSSWRMWREPKNPRGLCCQSFFNFEAETPDIKISNQTNFWGLREFRSATKSSARPGGDEAAVPDNSW